MAQRQSAAPRASVPAFAAVLAALVAGCAPQGATPRNVILVSLDTLRADRLGVYGYARETSPHLDAFAAESVVFDDALTQFTTTHYSHQVLFTGRYAFHARPGPSLAQRLSAAGYRTAGFTDGGYVNRDFGFDDGFDVYRDEPEVRGLARTVPLAIEWLRENREAPFFLFLHTYDIHCPYTPPEPWASLFQEGEPTLAFAGRCGSDFLEEPLDERRIEEINAAYDAGIRWADEQLAPLFEEMERLRLHDDTVVVITSDHGEALGHRGLVGHGRLSEPELAVPLILRAPGVAPRRVDEPVALVDVVPTLLAQLGIEAGPRLDGHDLGPVMRGEATLAGRPRVTQSVLGRVAFRSGPRWKLVTDGRAGGHALHDLAGDPERDVIDAHPAVARALLRELAAVLGEEPGARPFFRWRKPEEPVEVSPELREELRALGYLE